MTNDEKIKFLDNFSCNLSERAGISHKPARYRLAIRWLIRLSMQVKMDSSTLLSLAGTGYRARA